jgi:hypothetical protein
MSPQSSALTQDLLPNPMFAREASTDAMSSADGEQSPVVSRAGTAGGSNEESIPAAPAV